MQQKKYPPYSHILEHLIHSNHRPRNDINLFIGNHAWKRAENFSISYPERTLILPPWHDPGMYDWPVKGCSLLIFDTGYSKNDYVNDLAFYLYQDGANIVRYVSMD